MEMVHKVVSRYCRDGFASLAMTHRTASWRGAERRSHLVMHCHFREFI
jgi:hypothetical protein